MPDDLTAVFRREYAMVVRLARRLTGSAVDAEDIAQDVFGRLADEPVLDRPADEIRAWLWRTTTNRSFNRNRGLTRERRRLEVVGAQAAAGPTEGPDDVATRRDEAAHVRSVLADLSPRHREVLVLRHSGLSYADIATATGLAPGSVGTVLARAERAFRAAYEEADRAHVS